MKTARAFLFSMMCLAPALPLLGEAPEWENEEVTGINKDCLLYTSPSPRDS